MNSAELELINLKDFLNKVVLDNRLGYNHIRILIYVYEKTTFRASQVTDFFDFKNSYTNKIINELIDYGYLKVVSKIESTRILLYSFVSQQY